MSVLQAGSVEVPSSGTTPVVPVGKGSRVPGPLLFVWRAVATIWGNGKARAGLLILVAFVLMALLAPLIAPHDPTSTDFTPYLGPSSTNWFGTTGNGQDVFSQFVYGARVSLLVGLLAGFGATFVAVVLGLVRDFVTSAQFSGERLGRIVFREILPNMTSLVAASFFAAATAAVMAEASLEFLGLGNPSTISWGTMLYQAQQQNALLTGQWLMIFTPGLAIALLAMSFTLINFGVDALSNPRLREKS